MKIIIVAILLLLMTLILNAQNVGSKYQIITDTNRYSVSQDKLGYKEFILPSLMLTYGIIAINNDCLKQVNLSFKDEIYDDYNHKLLTIDNYSIFAPAALAFGLQVFGIKGKNNIKDKAIIYALSMGITTAIVTPIKYISNERRPDNSNSLSFPSGHTATAFASAEFLRREYKDVSVWYGISGYTIAIGTGFLRMYNNKHWFSDVIAGAGVGIASTSLAYWLHGKIKCIYKKSPTVYAYPILGEGNIGLGLVGNF